MNVEIKSIDVFEKDNGFEIIAKVNEKEYKVYAQLPDMAESEHAFIGENSGDDEMLQSIVDKAGESYSHFGFSVFSKLGFICNYEYKDYLNDYYVVVEKDNTDNYFFAKESRYNDYYNMFMFDDLSFEEAFDDELMTELRSLLTDLQSHESLTNAA